MPLTRYITLFGYWMFQLKTWSRPNWRLLYVHFPGWLNAAFAGNSRGRGQLWTLWQYSGNRKWYSHLKFALKLICASNVFCKSMTYLLHYTYTYRHAAKPHISMRGIAINNKLRFFFTGKSFVALVRNCLEYTIHAAKALFPYLSTEKWE